MANQLARRVTMSRAISETFLPLFPEERALGPLLETAAALIAEGHRLGGQASPPLRESLAGLLQAMNSYYTNKIEGQQTLPADIERALRSQFDADRERARRQRLALAHMEAERSLESAWSGVAARDLFRPERVVAIHADLYGRLSETDRVTDEGQVVVPGEYRTRPVSAGRHVAPPAEQLSDLMAAWGDTYAGLNGTERLVIGNACAHHRLAWVHPFIDGNGRATRLHSHLVLFRLGLTNGLWSPMRGLARAREAYYARLNNADLPRRNDLDGRGALSQEELVAFAAFFLDTCLDQVRFMSAMLALHGFRDRLADLLRQLDARPWPVGVEKSVVKPEASGALHYVALTGATERGTFMAMTGLPARTARRVLSSLLDFGLLKAESRVGPVSFNVPLRSLRWLFPRLWPEADQPEAP
jgi:Fic family protein